MLVRRYGSTIQSVDPNFDAKAMTEIGFRRTSGFSMPAEEFAKAYERVGEYLISGKSDAPVQKDAEESLLSSLLDQIGVLQRGLQEGDVLLFENEVGKDFPKMREQQKGVLVDGQNRIHFFRSVDPPIRLGHLRRT
jgi:hypothetical protein